MDNRVFSQKNIVITGAGSGLGKVLAIQFAQQNANLCLVDRDEAGLKRTLETVQQMVPGAWHQVCDITQQQNVDALFEAVNQRWSSLDVLVNNAGVATAGALEYEDLAQWQWVLDVNLLGMVRLTRALVPLMSSDAYLINVASQAGITPIPLMASYNASKAAVVSFSETMHLELASKGIHVSVVCPSFFPTNLDKSLRSGQPGIADLVSRMLKKSDISAEQVASIVIQQAAKKRFLILTHKAGKQAYMMRRFLPMSYYLTMLKNKTKQLVKLRDKT